MVVGLGKKFAYGRGGCNCTTNKALGCGEWPREWWDRIDSSHVGDEGEKDKSEGESLTRVAAERVKNSLTGSVQSRSRSWSRDMTTLNDLHSVLSSSSLQPSNALT